MKIITVVAGNGRCGSTLVMAMLRLGGMRTLGDQVSGEDDRVLGLPAKWRFLSEAVGGAVKILDPHRHTPPALSLTTTMTLLRSSHGSPPLTAALVGALSEPLEYRFIWVSRDKHEQAKSFRKWGLALGMDVPRAQIKPLASGLAHDEREGLKVLRALGPVLVVRFERLLLGLETVPIVQFVGGKVERVNMDFAVIPRPPECMRGFLETTLLANAEDEPSAR